MKTPQAPPLKERHLRFLLSYGPGIIYALDSVDFTVTFISENVAELVGYQVAQFLASGFWLTKVHPKDLPLVDDAFKALRAEGQHTYEYRFLHSDGTYHWMYDAMRLMPGAGSHPAEVFGVWLDITPRRRAQEELRATQEQVRRILSASPAVIYSLRVAGTAVAPVWVSDNISSVLGYTPLDCLEKNWWQRRVHPAERAQARKNLIHLLLEGHVVQEYRFRHKDRSYRWLRDEGRVVRWHSDEPVEVVGSWSDITERKIAEEALYSAEGSLQAGRERTRAAEARLARVFDTTPDAVVMINLDHTVVYLNGSARSLFGIGAEDDLDSRRFFGFQPDWAAQDITEHGLPMALAAGVWTGESAILTSAGQEIPVLLQILLHAGTRPEERMLSFIARDISEIKRVEAELRQAKDEAERANRAKSEFLSNMSHELRTPLTSILGFSELLAEGSCGEVNAQQELYLENILTSGRDLLSLVNDLLDLVKIEAGRIDLELVDIQVGPFVADIVDAMQAMAAKAGLGLEQHLEPSLPAVRVDPRRFKQMLLNLLSNAIKFTSGGGRIDVHVQVKKTIQPRGSVKIPGTWLAIAVTDSGVGIALEDLDRLFLAFEQVAGKQPAARPGTGLGLALTRRLARYHGGHVWVESAGLNQGSTFVLALPVRHGGEDQTP